jgi:hypothetical protein
VQDEEDQDWQNSRYFSNTTTLSQFLGRLRTTQRVTVRKVIKTQLAQRFELKWMEFITKYGKNSEEAKPRLAYHGTRANLINSITERGLLVPGTAPGVRHVTDSGFWGRGIYLSPDPNLSMGYARGGKMLVCSVLMGKVYQCTRRLTGRPCQRGYDSHISPSKVEYVIFNAAQVLPCYVIDFSPLVRFMPM